MERGQFQAIVQHETLFSGPLPPPEVIRGYDQILPGGAERIFSMAEREQLFRDQLENTAVTGAIQKEGSGWVVHHHCHSFDRIDFRMARKYHLCRNPDSD